MESSRETTPSDFDPDDLLDIDFSTYVKTAFRLERSKTAGVLDEGFERFLLEGKDERGCYLRLNTSNMRTRLGPDGVSLHRDYDSLIGFYARLPLFESVEFGLVPRPMDVLPSSSNLHVKIPEHLFSIVSLSFRYLSVVIHCYLGLYCGTPCNRGK
jgi:hypothetical protein